MDAESRLFLEAFLSRAFLPCASLEPSLYIYPLVVVIQAGVRAGVHLSHGLVASELEVLHVMIDQLLLLPDGVLCDIFHLRHFVLSGAKEVLRQSVNLIHWRTEDHKIRLPVFAQGA